ncbi:10212_t:CDS:2 [Entrophospora sp. SA101]|nr:10212_t:CDS:2 [Entrophospora sp. SA101]
MKALNHTGLDTGKKFEEQFDKDCSLPACDMCQYLDKYNPFAFVRKLSETFSNADMVAYYRRKIINDEDIIVKTACRHE